MSKALKVIPSLIAGLVFAISFSGCALNWGDYEVGFPHEGFEGYADDNQIYVIWAAVQDFVYPKMELETVTVKEGETSLKWSFNTKNTDYGDFLVNESNIEMLSDYSTLSFWISGASSNEAGNSIWIEVKDSSEGKLVNTDDAATETAAGSNFEFNFEFDSTEWVQIELDLTKYDLSEASRFIIGINGAVETGIVYLDDIILE